MKILPFSTGEQADIRRLLRQADPAREIDADDLARMERAVMASLPARNRSLMYARFFGTLRAFIMDTPLLSWPAAAGGAIAAGLLIGNLMTAPMEMPGSLVAAAAVGPWMPLGQQVADEQTGYLSEDN